VGVLGGVGPLATAYFLQLVVRLTDADRDQDHLDMVVFDHASLPDRTAHVLDPQAPDPGPQLAQDVRRLEAFGAGLLVMPCNTAHSFTQHIVDAASVPFVSIVGTTVDATRSRFPEADTVGLLATQGTVLSGVYAQAFAAHGIATLVPEPQDQETVSHVIYDQVKAGRPVDLPALQGVVSRLLERGAAAVVLGCTELSVAAADHDLLADPRYVDSLDQLARATIVRAGHRVRD